MSCPQRIRPNTKQRTHAHKHRYFTWFPKIGYVHGGNRSNNSITGKTRGLQVSYTLHSLFFSTQLLYKSNLTNLSHGDTQITLSRVIQVSLSGRTQTRLPLRSSQDHSYGDTKYKGKGYTYSPTKSITCSRNHPPLVAHGKVIHLVITHGLTWPHVCIHVSPPPSHGWEPQPIIPTISTLATIHEPIFERLSSQVRTTTDKQIPMFSKHKLDPETREPNHGQES